jgi:hypothetical protein
MRFEISSCSEKLRDGEGRVQWGCTHHVTVDGVAYHVAGFQGDLGSIAGIWANPNHPVYPKGLKPHHFVEEDDTPEEEPFEFDPGKWAGDE